MKDGNVFLTKEEKENIYTSLSCRLGIIETGSPMLRAKDAEKCGGEYKKKIRALSSEQMQLIIDTEKLMGKMFE